MYVCMYVCMYVIILRQCYHSRLIRYYLTIIVHTLYLTLLFSRSFIFLILITTCKSGINVFTTKLSLLRQFFTKVHSCQDNKTVNVRTNIILRHYTFWKLYVRHTDLLHKLDTFVSHKLKGLFTKCDIGLVPSYFV